jgi:hypothetical protein
MPSEPHGFGLSNRVKQGVSQKVHRSMKVNCHHLMAKQDKRGYSQSALLLAHTIIATGGNNVKF